jgi:hypothetical protein
MIKWSVLVSGNKVNLVHLSQRQAENMAQAWEAKGYDDVVIEQVSA